MKTDHPTPRTYGVPSLTLLVIASMVGAGVFTTSGFTLGAVGSPARVMLCWGLGGVIALCGAVAYGRLASIMPESGGEYLYLSQNVHPMVGFLAGWTSLTAGFSGAIATAAVAFESYALPDTIRPNYLPPDSLAVSLVVVCGLAHGMHAVAGKLLQNVIVGIKVLALAAFCFIVMTKWPQHSWHWEPSTPPTDNIWQATVAVAQSLVWISLSFAGFNAAVYVASESPDAKRSVPKALLLGTLAVTVLYLLLNLVFVCAVPINELAWQEPVAAIAAKAIGGSALEFLMRIAVSLGLLSSVLGMIMTGPRVYSKMADDGVFPTAFSARTGGIPRSIMLQTAIAIGLILVQRILVEAGILSSSLLGLLIYLGTTLSISSALCVATLFLPKVRQEMKTERSIFVDTAAAMYVFATLTAVVLMTMSQDADGNSQWLQHLSGAGLTLLSGGVAWQYLKK